MAKKKKVEANPYQEPPFEEPCAVDWARSPGDDGLTDPERRIVRRVLEGQSPTQAGLSVGYDSTATGNAVMQRPNVMEALHRALDAEGLSDSFLARKLKAGLDATKAAMVLRPGSAEPALEMVDDFNVQSKYLDKLIDLKGYNKHQDDGEGSWEEQMIQIRMRRSKSG